MYIAVVDTGSSSMRISLVDSTGRIIFSNKQEYCMVSDHTGKCEMPSELFDGAILSLCKSAAAFADGNGIRISAISLTSQRSSVLPLDSALRPLSPIIMWHDKRSQYICDRINQRAAEQFYKISGMRLSPIAFAPKMAYIKEQYPGIYQRTFKFVTIHDYLLLLLTGQLIADSSCACRSGLYDITSGDWSDALTDLFSLDKEKLCPIVPSGSAVGIISEAFHQKTAFPKVPVISAGGDQQCSVLGQNLSGAAAGLTTGTGGYLSVILNAPVFDPLMRTSLTAAVVRDRWIMEANTLSAGTVFRWFNDEFYNMGSDQISYDMINRDVASAPPGAGGVIMLPYLSGKGCPDWNAYAKGAFFNIGPDTSRSRFARAVIEGICAEICDCLATLSEVTGQTIERLNLCGGLSKASEFAQIISDMTNATVTLYNIGETTTLGAWALAAGAVLLYASPEAAVKAFYASCQSVHYTPDASQHKIYCGMQSLRRKLYEVLPHEQIYNIMNGEKS